MEIELFKHNKLAYENVINIFKNNNRCCIIHPTGSGKSFIALKWILDNKNKNILIMAPNYIILDQMIEKVKKLNIDEQNLTFSIYSNISFETLNKTYDCIILDEFHRCGALKWGKKINFILNNNVNAKILGFSATPIRNLDNNRDMSNEIFLSNIASEISLVQSIILGILPVPKYINAIYTFKDDIDRIQGKINNCKNTEKRSELQKKLDIAKNQVNKAYGINNIFEKHLPNKSGKYIVFCKNIEHMKLMIQESKNWFEKINDIDIYSLSSDYKRQQNKITIEQFSKNNNNKIKLLFCIEMLNEGFHLDDIDGVIMLRTTKSNIVFKQQLGRALTVGNNNKPVIFDIVNNSESHDCIRDLYNEIKNTINVTLQENNTHILENFIIYDEINNIIELFKEIENDSMYCWNDYYQKAKEYYQMFGNLNIPERYIIDNINLGSWISRQRLAKKNIGTTKINEEQIRLLDDIGMIWDIIQDIWYQNYEKAKEFYLKNGHLKICASYKIDGINLGKWIINQRICKKENNLDIEKINLLDNIGMIWNYNTETWENNYLLAKQYYEAYGNLNIPVEYKIDEINLGKWIHTQRSIKNKVCKGNLTKEQIEKLNCIGMIWDVNKMQWENNYSLAKQYYETYGNLNIPKRYKINDISLGTWIVRQRQNYYGKGKRQLTNEEIELLNNIGMIWDIEDYKFKNTKITSKNLNNYKNKILEIIYEIISEDYEFKSKNDIDTINKQLIKKI